MAWVTGMIQNWSNLSVEACIQHPFISSFIIFEFCLRCFVGWNANYPVLLQLNEDRGIHTISSHQQCYRGDKTLLLTLGKLSVWWLHLTDVPGIFSQCLWLAMFFPLALSFFPIQEYPGTEGFNTLMGDYFGCAIQSAILFFCLFLFFLQLPLSLTDSPDLARATWVTVEPGKVQSYFS